MKLKTPIKNKSNATFSVFLTLMAICCLSFIFIVIMSCLLGRLIVYFKTNKLIFDWGRDLLYSLKIGIVAGSLTGIGIWIKTKLQEQQEKNK